MSSPVDRRLLARLGGARLSVASSIAIGVISTAAVAAQALVLARLLAAAMPVGHVPAHLDWRLAELAGATLVRAGAAAGAELVGRAGAERVKAGLRHSLLLAAAGAGRRNAPSAGTLATLAGPGLDGLDVYVARCLPDLVLGALAPVTLLVAVGLVDWPSALVVLVVLGLFPLFGALVGRSSGALARRRLGEVNALGDRLVDLFAGLPVLRSFGRAADQRRALAAASEALRRSSLAALRVAFLSALVLDTLASVSTALVAVPLGLRLIDGGVRLAPALTVLLFAPEVFLPLRRASAEFHESAAGLAAAGKVLDAIDVPAAVSAAPAAPAGSATAATAPCSLRRPATVELAGVTVEVGVSHASATGSRGEAEQAAGPAPATARCLFEGIELLLRPGERVALVGPSGSGKTTLLQLLLGFLQPTAGSVLVDSVPLGELDADRWLASTAYLPERPALLSASVADNLRLAAPGASEPACREALALAGAGELVELLGGSLDTVVGDGGRPLSAGQRQRLGIARVLLREASLYLLDEPTAHLDERSERLAVVALDEAIGTSSAVLVTHRPAVLELAGRTLRLGADLPGVPATLRPVAPQHGPERQFETRRRLVAAGATP